MGIAKGFFSGVLLLPLAMAAGAQEYQGGKASTAAHEEHEWATDADLTLTFDDNLSKAHFERDRVEDISTLVRLDNTLSHQVNPAHLLSAGLFFGAEVYNDIEPLSHGTLGFHAAWRSVHRAGFTQPMFEVNLSTQYDDYGVEQRDSLVTQVQFFMTRRFTDRITTTFGADYRWRESSGIVFDTERARFFLNLDYRVYQEVSLYLTGSHAEGDVVSSSQIRFCNGVQANDILPLVNAATAIEPDEALNRSLCGDWVAYRGKADTNAATLGSNIPVGHSASIDISALHADVESQGWDVGYERTLYRVSFLKRF